MIYSINYDLHKPGKNYEGLHEAIKTCGDWWHHLGSTWLVDSALSAGEIWNRLQPQVDNDDSVLIIGVTRNYSGWLPQRAWDWIREHHGQTV